MDKKRVLFLDTEDMRLAIAHDMAIKFRTIAHDMAIKFRTNDLQDVINTLLSTNLSQISLNKDTVRTQFLNKKIAEGLCIENDCDEIFVCNESDGIESYVRLWPSPEKERFPLKKG